MKLWFSCCLILGATFVNGGITEEETFDPYKTLQEIDEKFWQQIYTYHQKQLKRYQKTLAGLFDAECSISQNVTNYLEPFYASNGLPKLFGEPTPIDISKNSTLDFSSASMLNIISMFYEILQCKAYYRDDREGGYNTNSIGLLGKIGFNEDNFGLLNNGKMIDPYFTKINIAEKEYHLHLNYSGGKNSKQPGNCCLKQGNESPQKWINGRTYNCQLLDNDHYILQNLLLCLEVSRRKVEDGDRLDVYCKLPILGAIIMGLELMNTQKIIKNDFFVGQYCCFSKKEREKNIKNLLYTFLKYKEEQNIKIQTKKQLKEELQALYRKFLGHKITDRIFLPTEITDLINKKAIVEKLKKQGFTRWEPAEKSTLGKDIITYVSQLEFESSDKGDINSIHKKFLQTINNILGTDSPIYILDGNATKNYVKFLAPKDIKSKTKLAEKQIKIKTGDVASVKSLRKDYFEKGFVFLHAKGKDGINRWFYLNKSNGTMYLLSKNLKSSL